VQRADDLRLAGAVERGLLLVDDEPVLRLNSSTNQSTSTTPSVLSIFSRPCLPMAMSRA